jgi:hypothetical protein
MQWSRRDASSHETCCSGWCDRRAREIGCALRFVWRARLTWLLARDLRRGAPTEALVAASQVQRRRCVRVVAVAGAEALACAGEQKQRSGLHGVD